MAKQRPITEILKIKRRFFNDKGDIRYFPKTQSEPSTSKQLTPAELLLSSQQPQQTPRERIVPPVENPVETPVEPPVEFPVVNAPTENELMEVIDDILLEDDPNIDESPMKEKKD